MMTNPDRAVPPLDSPTPSESAPSPRLPVGRVDKRRSARFAALGALLLLAGACGGGDDAAVEAAPAVVVEGAVSAGGGDPSAGSGSASAEAGQTDEELALAFAQCMRDEGVDFEDPTVNADGSIQLFNGAGQGANGGDGGRFDEATQDALAVCGDLIEGASFLPGGGDLTEAEDQLLEFAQCLRDQGLDVDDPDLSGGVGGGGRGPFGDFDPQAPENADAIDACQDALGGGFRGRGN